MFSLFTALRSTPLTAPHGVSTAWVGGYLIPGIRREITKFFCVYNTKTRRKWWRRNGLYHYWKHRWSVESHHREKHWMRSPLDLKGCMSPNDRWVPLTLWVLSATAVVCSLFYWQVKSLLLGIPRRFKSRFNLLGNTMRTPYSHDYSAQMHWCSLTLTVHLRVSECECFTNTCITLHRALCIVSAV